MWKQRRFKLICILAMCLFVGSAAALPPTNTVIVNGIEWAQVNDFTNLSWNQMNTQCPAGVCGASAVLNGVDLAGWTWASCSEVADLLFKALTPHPGGCVVTINEDNSAWAPNVFAIGFVQTQGSGSTGQVRGFSRTLFPNLIAAFTPLIENAAQTDIASTSVGREITSQVSYVGGWFFRSTAPIPLNQVSIPYVLPVAAFGFGILILLGRYRRQRG